MLVGTGGSAADFGRRVGAWGSGSRGKSWEAIRVRVRVRVRVWMETTTLGLG